MESKKTLFTLFFLLNIAAILIGFGYYYEQLSQTSFPLLFFVPDCPLYVFLFLLVVLGQVKNDAFSFLVSVGMVKYGLWTVLVLLLNPSIYFSPENLLVGIVFLFGHLGMAFEGLIILPKKKLAASIFALVLLWFMFNDFTDYFLSTAPPIPQQSFAAMRDLSFILSVAVTSILFFFSKQICAFSPVLELRKIAGFEKRGLLA